MILWAQNCKFVLNVTEQTLGFIKINTIYEDTSHGPEMVYSLDVGLLAGFRAETSAVGFFKMRLDAQSVMIGIIEALCEGKHEYEVPFEDGRGGLKRLYHDD